MIPDFGTPFYAFHRTTEDDKTRDWILKLIDKSRDRLAYIAMPHADTDEEIDALQDDFSRGYELAKAERPNLAVKALHGVDVGNGRGNSHVIVVVHEHKWVGGYCANGCPDTRPAAA